MGNVIAKSRDEPPYLGKSKFDPMEGFPNGRKKRVQLISDQEMRALKLPLVERDYCAHHLKDLEQCKVRVWPWVYKCKAFTHAWNVCEYEDWVLRMKEYERERRLYKRQRQRAQKADA